MLKGINFSEIQTYVPEYSDVKLLVQIISYEDSNPTCGTVLCSSTAVSRMFQLCNSHL